MRRSLDRIFAVVSLVTMIVLSPVWSRVVWDFLLGLVPSTSGGTAMLLIVFGFVFIMMLYSFHLLWSGGEKVTGVRLYSKAVLPIVAVMCVVLVFVLAGGTIGIHDLVYWVVEVNLRYVWMLMNINLLAFLMISSLGILFLLLGIDLLNSARIPPVFPTLKALLISVFFTSAVLINEGYGNFHIGVTKVFVPRPIDEAKAGRDPFEEQIVVSMHDFSPEKIRGQFVDSRSIVQICAKMPSHYFCR